MDYAELLAENDKNLAIIENLKAQLKPANIKHFITFALIEGMSTKQINEVFTELHEGQKKAVSDLAALREHVCSTCGGVGSVGSPPDDYQDCPECVAPIQKLSDDNYRKGKRIEELEQKIKELELDSARWNALIDSPFRLFGYAGLQRDDATKACQDYGENGYAHFGCEMWTKHSGWEAGSGRDILTGFADQAILATKQEGEDDES